MTEPETGGISAEQVLINCCMGSWPSICMAWLKTSASVWCKRCNLHILNMAVCKTQYTLTDWLIIGQLYFFMDLGKNTEKNIVTPFDQACRI